VLVCGGACGLAGRTRCVHDAANPFGSGFCGGLFTSENPEIIIRLWKLEAGTETEAAFDRPEVERGNHNEYLSTVEG
jgi:hypothetical protein